MSDGHALDLRVWQELAENRNAALVRAAGEVAPGDVRGVEGLRKLCSDVEVVRAALMLAEARRKAVAKFGVERAAGLWADPEGVEMATSRVVARHKWSMVLAIWSFADMLDLCCGLGGDTMVLAEEFMEVVPVDVDPVRAWMAEMNTGRRAMCADVSAVEPVDGPFHIDPARREGGKRSFGLDGLRPPVESWRRFVERAQRSGEGGAIKLGPGVDLDEVDLAFPGSQTEIISERGTLVQAVVWVLPMWRGGNRVATMVRGDPEDKRATGALMLSSQGQSAAVPPSAERMGRYLYEPDDSVERAGLFGVLCEKVGAVMLDPRVGLLTSDELIESPWVTGFEVLEVMGWHEKRMKAALETRGAGIVEVKTRGKVVEPDVVQRALRGKGDERLTVFVLRFGREVRGIIARRVEHRPASQI